MTTVRRRTNRSRAQKLSTQKKARMSRKKSRRMMHLLQRRMTGSNAELSRNICRQYDAGLKQFGICIHRNG